MKELFFWKVWSRSERFLTWAVMGTLVFAILFLVFKLVNPLGNTVHWDVLSELSSVDAPIDVLQLGQWRYSVSVPSQLVSEQFQASAMTIDYLSVRVFWILAVAGLSVLLAGLTTLSRFWYLSAMILLILLVAAARPETLNVFGEDSRALFLTIVVLVAGTSYYLHAFRPDLGIAARAGALLGSLVIVAVLIAVFSPVASQGITAWAFSTPVWLVLSAIFILMSATELLAGLVWLSTAGQGVGKGKQSATQLVVISLLYLLSLLLLYLRNTKQIDWDFSLINPAWYALLSGVVGIWGFRRRADSTKGLLPFRSAGFWIYAGLFLIALAFAAQVAATSNDPLLEVLEDLVVNGQLAMGILFLFYILINFFQPIRQGLAVHKVLYKPMRFGLTQTRLFGFVGVVLLFSMQRIYPVYQSIAGYFNGLGDLYAETGENQLAEQYYKMALQQDFQNHKSNYALASLAQRLGDDNAAAFYFRQALTKNPSAQAYAGLTGVLMQERMFFDAIYSLQEGIRKFPESGELLNNLGILYTRTNVADSAFIYLDQALKHAVNPEVPATNLLMMTAKNAASGLPDSLIDTSKSFESLSWKANALAVRTIRQQFDPVTKEAHAIGKDSLLSVAQLAYLYNYATNQARNDSVPASTLPKLVAKNPTLSQDLELGALYAEFYSGNKLKALDVLNGWVKDGGEKAVLYKKILGHWYLQLGLYTQAVNVLSDVEGIEGSLGVAIANALAGRMVEAEIILDRLQEKQPNASLGLLKAALVKGDKPVTPANELLAAALKNPSAQNFEKAVRANPFDEKIVVSASQFYRKGKQTQRAYAVVLNAIRMNETSPGIWEEYTFLSLDQGLLGQAEEGEAQVKEYASDAGYQQFLTRYQPQRALIEKQRASFQ